MNYLWKTEKRLKNLKYRHATNKDIKIVPSFERFNKRTKTIFPGTKKARVKKWGWLTHSQQTRSTCRPSLSTSRYPLQKKGSWLVAYLSSRSRRHRALPLKEENVSLSFLVEVLNKCWWSYVWSNSHQFRIWTQFGREIWTSIRN